MTLPDGLLTAWYGDDFTGAAAVAEVMTFSGLPAVLFLDVPTPDRLDRFRGYRGIGIAGLARAKSGEWMRRELPAAFRALKELKAPISHYKICSTLDSSPEIGSIGLAIDLAQQVFGSAWCPLIVAAPPIHRHQAFGNLFASAGGVAYRLDRHPTMSRHPVTPMHEADVVRHLAAQTQRPIGLVDLVAMKAGRADAALASARAQGAEIVALDVIDDETQCEAGRLVWENRGDGILAIGSQGLQYALIAHWQERGLVAPLRDPAGAGKVDRIAVVSGSCSPVTAGQIAWAQSNGFRSVRVDAARAVDQRLWNAEIERAASAALAACAEGASPLLFTAAGPDDPALAAVADARRTSGAGADTVNVRIGEGLGAALDKILRGARLRRGVISGGDTSGHGASALGIYALTALAPTVPGAALFTAHSDDPVHDRLQIALKGGQMGTDDYFGRIREGGGLQ